MSKIATLVHSSKNAKVGFASATYVSVEASCPTDCAQRDAGCYAQTGNVGIHVRRMDKNSSAQHRRNARIAANAEAKLLHEAIAKNQHTLPLRLHVSGDCRTPTAAKIVSGAASRWKNKVWTYTHAWKRVPRSAWGKVSVLASVDCPADIEKAVARGYAPAIVVPKHTSPRATKMYGVKFIPCPAQTKEAVNCVSCGLCLNADRLHRDGFGISFAAHGVAKNKLTVIK
jgi:hypothetical protein